MRAEVRASIVIRIEDELGLAVCGTAAGVLLVQCGSKHLVGDEDDEDGEHDVNEHVGHVAPFSERVSIEAVVVVGVDAP